MNIVFTRLLHGVWSGLCAMKNPKTTDRLIWPSAVIHCIYLKEDKEQEACSRPCPKEYVELKWWSLSDLKSHADSFHTCLIQALQMLETRTRRAYEELEEALSNEESNSNVALKPAAFVAKWKDTKVIQSHPESPYPSIGKNV